MSNMSYCRFRNTLYDLQDCKRALNEGALDNDSDTSKEEDNDYDDNVGEYNSEYEGSEYYT